MPKVLIILFSALVIGYCAIAQPGNESFTFLNTSGAARVNALGGQNVSLADRDINLITYNPTLASDSLSGWGSVNYQFYLSDIHQAQVVYLHDFGAAGTFGFAIQQMNYGTIDSYDEAGLPLGTYNANETMIAISRSHQVNHFRFGLTLKGAFSNLAGFRASAVMADLGGLFVHPTQELTAGLSLRNVGLVLSEYTSTGNFNLPFDLAAGVTFKPAHMPIRFSLTAHHLDEWETVDGTERSTLETVFAHLNLAGEILLSKNVNLMAGYNFLTHQEMTIETIGSSAGLSLGFSAKVRHFEFAVARSSFQRGSASYSFTVSGNVRSMIKGRK